MVDEAAVVAAAVVPPDLDVSVLPLGPEAAATVVAAAVVLAALVAAVLAATVVAAAVVALEVVPDVVEPVVLEAAVVAGSVGLLVMVVVVEFGVASPQAANTKVKLMHTSIIRVNQIEGLFLIAYSFSK